mgnify:CR=1 FL=1
MKQGLLPIDILDGYNKAATFALERLESALFFARLYFTNRMLAFAALSVWAVEGKDLFNKDVLTKAVLAAVGAKQVLAAHSPGAHCLSACCNRSTVMRISWRRWLPKRACMVRVPARDDQVADAVCWRFAVMPKNPSNFNVDNVRVVKVRGTQLE